MLLMAMLGCYVFSEQCEPIDCGGAFEAEQCCGPSPFGKGTACWYRFDGIDTTSRLVYEDVCEPSCESPGVTQCGEGACLLCSWEIGPNKGDRWYSCDDGAWESSRFRYGELGDAHLELECYCDESSGWCDHVTI